VLARADQVIQFSDPTRLARRGPSAVSHLPLHRLRAGDTTGPTPGPAPLVRSRAALLPGRGAPGRVRAQAQVAILQQAVSVAEAGGFPRTGTASAPCCTTPCGPRRWSRRSRHA